MARPERHAGAGKRPGRAHGHNGHAAGAGQRAGSPLSEEMRVANDWEERRGGPRDQVQPKQKISFLIRKASPPSYPQPALPYVRKSFATRDFSGIGASRAPVPAPRTTTPGRLAAYTTFVEGRWSTRILKTAFLAGAGPSSVATLGMCASFGPTMQKRPGSMRKRSPAGAPS